MEQDSENTVTLSLKHSSHLKGGVVGLHTLLCEAYVLPHEYEVMIDLVHVLLLYSLSIAKGRKECSEATRWVGIQ